MGLPFFLSQNLADAQRLRPQGVPVSSMVEIMRLRRRREADDRGARAALDRLKASAAESERLSQEEAGLYQDVPSYKRPQRKQIGGNDALLGIGLGLVGALTGHRDPSGLTGTALGGIKARNEQEYADEMDTLRERMAADDRLLRGKVAGLQARQQGLATRSATDTTSLNWLTGEAQGLGNEAFQLEQAATGKAERDRAFMADTLQRGFSNALANRADKRAEMEMGMRRNPYQFLNEQAASLAPMFGGDVKKARQALVSDLIVNQAQAEWMPKILETEYGMKGTAAKAAAEDLKQLQTRGKYLGPQLAAELAQASLSMANTRQIMSERAEQIKAIKEGRATGDLSELQKLQYQDAFMSVRSLEDAIRGINEKQALYDPNNESERPTWEAFQQTILDYKRQIAAIKKAHGLK